MARNWTVDIAVGPQVKHSIRIEVLDQTGAVIGELTPVSTPTVEANIDGTIHRRLTGLTLNPVDAATVDPYSDRLRPVWHVNGTDHNLGVYLWATTSYRRRRNELESEAATAHDQMFVLQQPFPQSTGFRSGVKFTTAIRQLVEAVGITDTQIDESPLSMSAPMAWPVGSPRLDAVTQTAARLGYVAYFDRDGVFRACPRPDPDIDAPTHHYDEDAVAEGVGESDDLWHRPNTWLAVSTAATDEPITGTFRLPDSHPASEARRGFPVVERVDAPGATSAAAAEQIARDAARQATTTAEVEIVTAPNPTHDLHDIVTWRGTNYREVGWTLPLSAEAEMSHRLRRTDAIT